MADESDDDKTEDPTEKRLADAIERGNTPVSREIAFLTSIIAYLLIEIYVLPAVTPDLVASIVRFLDDPAGWRLETQGDVVLLARALALIVARFLAPAVLLLIAFGVGGSVFQNAPRIVAQRIAPDFKRLSPLSGFTRLFGPRGWTEFGKSALKLGAVVAVVAVAARRRATLAGRGDVRRRRRAAEAFAVALRRRHQRRRVGAPGDRRRRFHLDAHPLAARSTHEPPRA